MNTIIEKIRAEVERLYDEANNYDDSRHYLGEVLSFLSDLEKSENPINPTIEKLRALIKMQIRREELNFASLGGGGKTMNIGALEWVLKQLDSLQEPIDKWSNKERKARVKKTGEIVCGFMDGQGHFDIPTDHNEFIRYNLDELEFDTLQEQPVDWQKVAEAHAKDQPLGQDNDGNLVYLQEQPVDLEKEIENYAKSYNENGINLWDWEHTDDAYSDMIRGLARHFYELGQQSKEQPLLPGFENEQPGIPGKDFVPVAWCEALEQYGIWRIERVEQPVCEGLEEEIQRFLSNATKMDKGEWKGKYPISEMGFGVVARHFAQWGAEHLKK